MLTKTMVGLTAGLRMFASKSFISGLAGVFTITVLFFCSSEISDDWECFPD